MSVLVRLSVLVLVLPLFACAQHSALRHVPTYAESFPPPIDSLSHKDSDRSAQRRAWIEQMHRAGPDDDWREIDAYYLARTLQERMQARQAAIARGADAKSLGQVSLTGAALGQWVERGSNNQSGRMIDADYDPATGRLLSLAHGGQLWAASLSTLDWSSLNDAVQFRPNGTGGSFLRLPGQGNRLIVASDRPVGVYYSDDDGGNWTPANGFPATNASYAHGLVARGPGGAEVYMLRHYYDTAAMAWRLQLFASTDAGQTFVSLGFVGERNRVALFASRYDSSEVYLLSDANVYRIVSGSHALNLVATLPITSGELNNRVALLTGGVDTQGDTFLYAIYSLGGTGPSGTSRVFRSLDNGQNWVERTQAPTGAFSYNGAASSSRDPQQIYIGGVEMYRSHDGGQNWTRVNTWQSYYPNPETRLHADIPSIDVFRDGPVERIFISTDGGIYESTDAGINVTNLSMAGLRVSQYYGTYTVRSAPYAILAGAQDQGFQKAAAHGSGVLEFNQTISGDYGHLTSSDGGGQLWSNYPGFTMLDLTPQAMNQGGLRFWNFTNNSFTGWLFLAPMVAHPNMPNRVSLAGGRIGGGDSHRIVQLTWNGSSFAASQTSQNFGSQVTAIAIDGNNPSIHYAMTSARQFFRSNDGGQTWTNTASNLPANHYFWGQRILPDPVTANRVYVAGSGYSNPPVFVSDDGGNNFQPFSTGLPSTLVYDVAASADGQHLFAATEVGPFYYDPVGQSWQDITSLGGPAQTFWHVEFIDELNLARFATYGRGIWDFELASDVIFADGFD